MFWHNQKCSHSVKETINRRFHERIFKSIEIFHIKGKTTSVKDIISYTKQKCNNLNKRQEFYTEVAIKNGQSRETGNKAQTNKAKPQHNMCWTPLYAKIWLEKNISFINSSYCEITFIRGVPIFVGRLIHEI